MNLQIEVTDAGGLSVIVAITGELDLYTAPKLRERLDELILSGRAVVVIDLEKLDFMDSSGINVLVGSLKRLRASGGELRLVCTQPRLLKLFEITGLLSSFAIYGSVATAAPSAAAGTPPA